MTQSLWFNEEPLMAWATFSGASESSSKMLNFGLGSTGSSCLMNSSEPKFLKLVYGDEI